jgi:hypothetical protein
MRDSIAGRSFEQTISPERTRLAQFARRSQARGVSDAMRLRL